MADVAKVKVHEVKEVVKETLLGADLAQDVKATARSKAVFEENARSDGEAGELYMSEEDFVNAVAPVGEDYVSNP